MNKKVFLFIIALVFLTLRLWSIGFDISNSDAARWHRRSESFLAAIKKGDFASTYRHYQPGVTLMWVNALVKQSLTFYQYYSGVKNLTLENYQRFPLIDGISKTANIIILFTVLCVQMFLISKILNLKIAAIYGFLISIEPYVVGIDRWFHLTSFETYLGFTAFLFVLLYRKEIKIKWLICAGILLALSILSKLTSLILLPLLVLIIFSSKKSYRHIFLFVSITLLSMFLLFPALWVDLPNVLSKLLSAITNAVSDDVRATELQGLTSSLFYPIMLLFKLSPITLFVFLIAVFKVPPKTYFMILLYFLFYMLCLSVSQKKIDRYMLVLLPPILLIVSIYLSTLGNRVLILICGVYIIFTTFLIYVYHPVYSAYYSPLFGGTKNALDLGIYDNSGEYFAQTAFYLNEKGRDVSVYIPDNFESFSYYYGGNKLREFSDKVEYLVTSVDIDRKSANNLLCPILEKSFGPRDFEQVVYIYKCH